MNNYNDTIDIMKQQIMLFEEMKPIIEKFGDTDMIFDPRFNNKINNIAKARIIFTFPNYRMVNSKMICKINHGATIITVPKEEYDFRHYNISFNVELINKNGKLQMKLANDIWLPLNVKYDGYYASCDPDNNVIGIFNSMFGWKAKGTSKKDVKRVTTDIDFMVRYIKEWVEIIKTDDLKRAKIIKHNMQTEKCLDCM